MPHPLETYLRALRAIRDTGEAVEETSYYPPLSTLLNSVGDALSPRVRCVINLRNRGAGIPDGGFFTPEQLRGGSAAGAEPDFGGLLPARGALEVKGTGASATRTAEGEQVRRYLERYGQVLVTNLRDWVLVARGADGEAQPMEEYRLAPSEGAFWELARHPARAAEAQGADFVGYLRRVLTRAAPVSTPEDLAWLLAAYARDARTRAEAADMPALAALRSALEGALGMKFEGEKGEHFFRSTLVQTLFYGVFAAWVLHARQGVAEPFDWRTAGWTLRVPAIRALFHQISDPEKLFRLGLVEPLDWAADALSRVDHERFFARFEAEHAVQYFYEPFLQAFDPELRKELGVWYTPPEVVTYMVGRVDQVLRSELHIADGLADPRVLVLDPCCGTGAYLVAVLDRIAATLRERGEDALLGQELQRAAMERVFGFEMLPAPFVVAHLQLGLLLHALGADPADTPGAGRVAVYLTNALTGWDAGSDQQLAAFPELAAERDAAGQVKRDERILVVLGNPPYNGYPGAAILEERDLVEAYRSTTRTTKPQGQGLNDLYVRFFRMAERRIAEMTGKGVVCFISNYSWLDGLSFTGMRERYLEAFDRIWIDSLNGDRFRTGKLTPDGRPDPSIFSTETNREGIQVGTAIALMVRTEPHACAHALSFRNLWGTAKHAELLASLEDPALEEKYECVKPAVELGLPFAPRTVDAHYLAWPLLTEIFPSSFTGIQTARDDVVVDVDRERLLSRMRVYFDPKVSDSDLQSTMPRAMVSTSRFDAPEVRAHLLRRGLLENRIVRYLYRPFDVRWLYWEPQTKLLDEKRAEYFPQIRTNSLWLTCTRINRKEGFYPPQVTRLPADYNVIEASVKLFPLHLGPAAPAAGEQAALFDAPAPSEPRPNLSERATEYLRELDAAPESLFHHAVSVLHAPDYRAENAGALRQDWPRVPLPAARVHLEASAALGRTLAALLDPEQAVAGVTVGTVREELRVLGAAARAGGGQLSATDFALSAGWGHAGKGGAVMPGRGRAVERDYTPEERAAIEAGANALGLTPDQAFALLGARCLDVYLNEHAHWRCVPARVWTYTLGGYQVVKKWLSYREQPLLGRALTLDEVREVTAMTRRIAAILLMEPELNGAYAAVRAAVAGPA